MEKTKEPQPRISRRRVLRNVLGLSAVALMGSPEKAEAHPGNPLNPIFGDWDETAMIVGGLAAATGIIIATGRKSDR